MANTFEQGPIPAEMREVLSGILTQGSLQSMEQGEAVAYLVRRAEVYSRADELAALGEATANLAGQVMVHGVQGTLELLHQANDSPDPADSTQVESSIVDTPTEVHPPIEDEPNPWEEVLESAVTAKPKRFGSIVPPQTPTSVGQVLNDPDLRLQAIRHDSAKNGESRVQRGLKVAGEILGVAHMDNDKVREAVHEMADCVREAIAAFHSGDTSSLDMSNPLVQRTIAGLKGGHLVVKNDNEVVIGGSWQPNGEAR